MSAHEAMQDLANYIGTIIDKEIAIDEATWKNLNSKINKQIAFAPEPLKEALEKYRNNPKRNSLYEESKFLYDDFGELQVFLQKEGRDLIRLFQEMGYLEKPKDDHTNKLAGMFNPKELSLTKREQARMAMTSKQVHRLFQPELSAEVLIKKIEDSQPEDIESLAPALRESKPLALVTKVYFKDSKGNCFDRISPYQLALLHQNDAMVKAIEAMAETIYPDGRLKQVMEKQRHELRDPGIRINGEMQRGYTPELLMAAVRTYVLVSSKAHPNWHSFLSDPEIQKAQEDIASLLKFAPKQIKDACSMHPDERSEFEEAIEEGNSKKIGSIMKGVEERLENLLQEAAEVKPRPTLT